MKEAVAERGHIMKDVDQDLQRLRMDLLKMGGLVEKQMLVCERLLCDSGEGGEMDSMGEVKQRENKINQMELKIARNLIFFLTKHHLMAGDGRIYVSDIRTSLDLERIGDEVEHVAYALVELAGTQVLDGEIGKVFRTLLKRAKAALKMALHALSAGDQQEAHTVIDKDGEINALQRQLQQLLLKALSSGLLPPQQSIGLIQAARSLERIGDHAKNLSQGVIYVATGADPREQEVESKAGHKQ